jgi:hypothetical protein
MDDGAPVDNSIVERSALLEAILTRKNLAKMAWKTKGMQPYRSAKG